MNKKVVKIYYSDFIRDAFCSKAKNVIIRAGRQTGKTYGATQKAILYAVKNRDAKILWVDTVQGNIKRYIDEYFRLIASDLWQTIEYDKQTYTLTFANGSRIYFGSAERPENLEGFAYDLVILNEAGIILKKDGLWHKTIQPMTKKAQTFFIGTPKGKTNAIYFELSQLAGTSEQWEEFHYSCFDSPFWTKEQLDDIKKQVPSYIWLQEYLAEFVDVYENSMIEFADLRFYQHVDINSFDKVYMHADTTHTGKTTSDYFSLVVLAENKKDKNYYVLDFILDKLDVEQQARQSIVMYQKFKDKVKKFTYDEKANQGFGFWIKKLAREEYNLSLPIQELKYPSDKISHFTPHVPHFKANRVYLPSSHRSISIAQDQLLAFPTKNVNDDFIDGIAGVLDNFTTEQRTATIYTEPYFR
jgi:predicted phage terminase large subunit-like protein